MSDEISKFNVRGLGVERLKAIYYVGLTESMTKAGELLGVCQSAVSKQVQSIEDELGVVLFRRGDRKICTTDNGREIVKLTETILYMMDATLKSIKEKQEGLSGSLRILTFPSFSSVMAPRYLGNFNEQYPEINLKISATYQEMVTTEADIIIRTLVSHPKLEQLPLYEEYYGLYANKQYLEKHGEPKTIQELKNHKLIVLDPALEQYYDYLNWVIKVGVANKYHYRKYHMSVASNDALANSVIAGMGIGSLALHHVNILNNPNLVRILPSHTLNTGPVYLSFNKDVTHTEKYLALYQYLKQQIEKEAHIFNKS